MSGEMPDGLLQLHEHLKTTFTGIVPMSTSGQSAEERERNFLSRALAAYAIHKLSGCTLQEAAAAVVDGGGDGGIDAIYYAKQTTGTLWVVQSKYVAKGTGEPDGLEKFRNGLEAVLEADLSYFSENQVWKERIPEIDRLLNDSNRLQIHAVFVYSSIHAINSSKLGQFSKLKERFSAYDDYFTFRSYNLSSIVDWLTDAAQSAGVPEVKLTIYNPGRLATPYETIYGLIKLSDIATLYKVHGKQLVAANIRAYKGDTEVNAGIVTTLREMPEAFVYLNNGLTAYCERFNVFHADRGKSECKRITAHGFSVVNGAQTLGAINYRFTEAQAEAQEGYVFIKLISLERCENDVEFAQLITRTANYQNRIDLEHFIAQQPYQQEIARRLRFSDIYYHFRDDVETPTSDEYNFTLKDATTALACVDQMKDCDFVARIIANRKSLLSLDIDYPDDTLYKTRYSRVFKPDRSARTVWQAVQTQMVVIDKMKENVRASNGVRKSFFETARWLVLNLIFLQLKPEQGDELALTAVEMLQIGDKAIEYAELLWGVCETLGYVARQADGLGYEQPRHFRTIFSNATDCARLRGAVLARLNEKKR